MASERAERARAYARERWALYAQTGQLRMAIGICRAHYTGGLDEECAIRASDQLTRLLNRVNMRIEALNKRQKEELANESRDDRTINPHK